MVTHLKIFFGSSHQKPCLSKNLLGSLCYFALPCSSFTPLSISPLPQTCRHKGACPNFPAKALGIKVSKKTHIFEFDERAFSSNELDIS